MSNGAVRPPGGATAGAAVTRFALCQLSSGKAIHTTGATDQGYCVAQDSADADGDAIDVIVSGPTKAIAGGSLSVGDEVMPAAAGKVVVDDGATANRKLVGQVVEAPGTVADGDIVIINLYADKTNT